MNISVDTANNFTFMMKILAVILGGLGQLAEAHLRISLHVLVNHCKKFGIFLLPKSSNIPVSFLELTCC